MQVAVCNQGPTRAAEHRPRLFDRFYRAEAAIARMHGGTPLAKSKNGRTTISIDIDIDIDIDISIDIDIDIDIDSA